MYIVNNFISSFVCLLHGGDIRLPSQTQSTMSTEARYKVVKIMRKSNRRQVLERNLTLDEARRCVQRYPNSERSMVVFFQQ